MLPSTEPLAERFSELRPSGLRFSEDALVEEQQDHGFAVLVATLSDGSSAYQDDWVGGAAPFWPRLGDYLRRSGLWVAGLRVKFRSQWLAPVPAGRDSYYFRRGVAARLMGGPVEHFVVVGSGRPDCLVHRVRLPDLAVEYSEVRKVVEDDDGALLLRPG